MVDPSGQDALVYLIVQDFLERRDDLQKLMLSTEAQKLCQETFHAEYEYEMLNHHDVPLEIHIKRYTCRCRKQEKED